MVSQESVADVGRVLGGRYRVLAPIGTGASAKVYLADDITLRRRVAVKVLHEALANDAAFLRRFRAEAQAAASLNNPHVLGVYDWGHDDVPFLVSEYLAGGSLRSMLDAGHRLSASQALLVGLETARGLDYAHGEGLVHRDIKPANLLFDEGGRLRIADFGLARALAEAGWTEPDGSMVGTARYAAPEQARGERVGPAADVYALALVMNEAVSGEVPFARDTTIATLMARADTALDPHPELGPIQGIVRRAGALDPEERPTAGELTRELMVAAEDLPRPGRLPLVGAVVQTDGEFSDLTELADPTGSLPPRSVPAVPAEDDGSVRRWPWAILAVLAIAAAVVGGVLAWQQGQAVSHTVPDVVGSDQAIATAAVAEFGWVLDIRQVRVDDTSAGDVVATEPEAGIELEEGEILVIVVSLGAELVTVPDIVGAPIADAEARLIVVGLALGDVTLENSETVSLGLVMSVRLGVGVTEVDPGSAIDVVVSEGPSDRQVPEVPESRDPAEAAQLLVDRRLVPVEDRESSEEIPEGEVITYEPSPGAFVAVDTEVAVVISDGPAPRAIPPVIGLDVTEATEILEASGFVVTRVEGSPTFPVLETLPPAPEVHPFGTRVVIITRGL